MNSSGESTSSQAARKLGQRRHVRRRPPAGRPPGTRRTSWETWPPCRDCAGPGSWPRRNRAGSRAIRLYGRGPEQMNVRQPQMLAIEVLGLAFADLADQAPNASRAGPGRRPAISSKSTLYALTAPTKPMRGRGNRGQVGRNASGLVGPAKNDRSRPRSADSASPADSIATSDRAERAAGRKDHVGRAGQLRSAVADARPRGMCGAALRSSTQ